MGLLHASGGGGGLASCLGGKLLARGLEYQSIWLARGAGHARTTSMFHQYVCDLNH
jgi:hypothetical protein